jgi:hypothetical protein
MKNLKNVEKRKNVFVHTFWRFPGLFVFLQVEKTIFT